MQPTPIQEPDATTFRSYVADRAQYHLAVDLLSKLNASVRRDQAPIEFLEYVRTSSDAKRYRQHFAPDATGLDWFAAPKIPPHVSADAKAHYRLRHHLSFFDNEAAAKELRSSGLHITVGEAGNDFAAWLKTNDTPTIVDNAIFFEGKK